MNKTSMDEIITIISMVTGSVLIYYLILLLLSVYYDPLNYSVRLDALFLCTIGLLFTLFSSVYFWKKTACRKIRGEWLNMQCKSYD